MYVCSQAVPKSAWGGSKYRILKYSIVSYILILLEGEKSMLVLESCRERGMGCKVDINIFLGLLAT